MRKKTKKLLIQLTLITSIIYIVWRILFTLPLNLGIKTLIFGIIIFLVELWDFLEFLIHYFNILKHSQDEADYINIDGKLDKQPDVDIIIATINESEELLTQTIVGCLNIEYKDKSKVHIYISDDGNRSNIKELAEKYNINYITRNDNKDAKAGNYNNALKYLKSDYILTLDADMIPSKDILEKTIPYFLKDNDVGFVQTPQYFYNYDIYQSRFGLRDKIPFDQNFFYNILQTEKEKINSVVYCGTNAVISREALDKIGGFATGTLTEDIATRYVNTKCRV